MSSVTGKGKEIKGLQIGKKEVKLPLFAEGMTMQVENAEQLAKNSWN